MVHTFSLAGENIVLDVNSGAIHLVDEVALALIAQYERTTREAAIESVLERFSALPDVNRDEIEALYDEIETLKTAGKLFSAEPEHFPASISKPNAGVVKALCLHLAHTCNLTCDYCFARQGRFSGEESLMSFAVGKQALDFLLEHSGSRKHLEVDFFGGEPLLNWETLKELVAYARSQEKKRGKRFRFTLTTNGVLLDDEVIEFANQEMDNVVLSLDGRKEVHDKMRKFADGTGSFDVVAPKFQRLAERRDGKGYYIRGTFTASNLDFTKDVQQMLNLGFRELSMEPVVSSPNEPYALRMEHLPALYKEYEKLAQMMMDYADRQDPFHFYHYTLDLKNGPCLHKRMQGCGSGTEYLAVTPTGELYPCHQFVGEERFKLGDVWRGVEKQDICEAFSHCNVLELEACKECWAKYYCSGGCAANAYHATGEVQGIYSFGCELFKRRIEYAIAIQAVKEKNA